MRRLVGYSPGGMQVQPHRPNPVADPMATPVAGRASRTAGGAASDAATEPEVYTTDARPARPNMRAVWLVLVLLVGLTAVVLRLGLGEWRRPLAGALVDPFGRIDSYGRPGWPGYGAGLRRGDRVLAVDGKALGQPAGLASPTLDGALGSAAGREVRTARQAGRSRVTLTVQRGAEARGVEVPLGFAAWLGLCGGSLVLGWSWPLTVALSYLMRPSGRAVRAFVRWLGLGALLLLTSFDAHTTQRLVPL